MALENKTGNFKSRVQEENIANILQHENDEVSQNSNQPINIYHQSAVTYGHNSTAIVNIQKTISSAIGQSSKVQSVLYQETVSSDSIFIDALKRRYQSKPIAFIKCFYYKETVPIEGSFINLAIIQTQELKQKEQEELTRVEEFRDNRIRFLRRYLSTQVYHFLNRNL